MVITINNYILPLSQKYIDKDFLIETRLETRLKYLLIDKCKEQHILAAYFDDYITLIDAYKSEYKKLLMVKEVLHKRRSFISNELFSLLEGLKFIKTGWSYLKYQEIDDILKKNDLTCDMMPKEEPLTNTQNDLRKLKKLVLKLKEFSPTVLYFRGKIIKYCKKLLPQFKEAYPNLYSLVEENNNIYDDFIYRIVFNPDYDINESLIIFTKNIKDFESDIDDNLKAMDDFILD